MVKIINGKKYNTDTAEFIWTISPVANHRDFKFYEESLYRKRTGEYFLAGNGGPLTKYSRLNCQGLCEGGEKIIPVSIEEAKEWCERNLSVEGYEELFGEVEE